MFETKFLMRRNAILGNADHCHPARVEFPFGLTERDSLFGAAAGVVFRIKIEDERFSLERSCGQLLARVGRQPEGWRPVAGLEVFFHRNLRKYLKRAVFWRKRAP